VWCYSYAFNNSWISSGAIENGIVLFGCVDYKGSGRGHEVKYTLVNTVVAVLLTPPLTNIIDYIDLNITSNTRSLFLSIRPDRRQGG
jgi:hypothetical protein